MKSVKSLVVCVAGLLVLGDVLLAQDAPEIVEYQSGRITWTNMDPALYYTVEWLPTLSETNWTGSFRGLQDLQSSDPTITAEVPMVFRIIASTNALYTSVFSSETPMVPAGYYEATDLTAVDPDLAAGNLLLNINVFGITGTAVIATGDATEAQVLAGSTFSRTGAGGLTGTMPTQTLSANGAAVPAGYYAATDLATVDPDLASGSIHAGVTIFGVAGKAEVVDTTSGDAAAAELLAGRTAWVDGVAVTGTMPTQTLSANGAAVPAGYYAATDLSTVDPDLASGSIHAGVTIFGVAGKAEVVDTTSGDAVEADLAAGAIAWVDGVEITGTRTPAPVAKTGQTNTFGTGDDGDLELGVAWPNPRFTVLSDTNVVQDNLTGLMWARNANLDGTKDWAGALSYCQALDHGGYTDWRLPNVRELHSLIDLGRFNPALPTGHPFTGWVADDYWTSSMLADPSGDAWFMRLLDGYIDVSGTNAASYVWPVRGGQ
jgi:hypothetical protein